MSHDAPWSPDGPPVEEQDEEPIPPFILRLPDGPYEAELAALATWVELVLLPVYGREVGPGAPWCARWWDHLEAVARLHACWLAWQALTEPTVGGVTGPSVWQRDHLDPMLAQLRSPTGPFAACMTTPGVRNHTALPVPDVVPYPAPCPSADRERRA